MTEPPPRLRLTRALLVLAAVGALVSAAGAVAVVAAAPDDVRMVEAWRGWGFLAFAGLFLLLAARPLGYPWLWEVVLANKLALTATATVFAVTDSADDAVTVAVADGVLSLVLGVAYVACRGWRVRSVAA